MEDLKGNQSDSTFNSSHPKLLHLTIHDFFARKWTDFTVGDVVHCQSDNVVPADVVLFASSNLEGLYCMSALRLKGEADLKIKSSSPHAIPAFRGGAQPKTHSRPRRARSRSPWSTRRIPLGQDQLLRNTS
jgi:magnesium-transporting ATPase (P-type)